MKISIISSKGGVGKSTVAINLALAAAGLSNKPSIALVDCDKQKSALETLEGHSRDNLFLYEASFEPHKVIEKLKEKIIIIDTPPHLDTVMFQVAASSSLVVIPVQPSPLDIRAAANTVRVLRTIQEKYRPGLQCRFLINRLTSNTILANDIRDTLKKYYPVFQVLDTVLHDRQAYKQSLSTRQSVIEFNKASPAAKELGQLFVEIAKIARIKDK